MICITNVLEKENFLCDNIIAHRGLHNIENGVIENSIEAFRYAIDKKYIIELDVHILKDDEIIVFHDDNLQRLTGVNKKVLDVSYDEIKELKLKNTNSYIPKLEEVLKLINGKVPILIEIKNFENVGKLEKKLLEILKAYKGMYAVQSFNPFCIYWFKKNAPNVLRGQLSSSMKNEKFLKKLVLKNMFFNFLTKPDFISYSVSDLNLNKIKKIRKKYILLGWTVRNKSDYEKLKKEYDNLICENFI